MQNAKGCLVLLVIALMIGAFAVAAFDTIRPHTIDPSQDSINMIQPYGWMPERDAHYAQEVNDPNSHANLNNGQANLYNAQATAVVYDAKSDYIHEEDKTVKGQLWSIGWVIGIFAVIAGLYLVFMAR